MKTLDPYNPSPFDKETTTLVDPQGKGKPVVLVSEIGRAALYTQDLQAYIEGNGDWEKYRAYLEQKRRAQLAAIDEEFGFRR